MTHLAAMQGVQAYQSLSPEEKQGLLKVGTTAFIGQIILWGIIITVVITIISIVGYYIYKKFGIGGFAGLISGEGTPLLCPDGMEETTGGLCYQKCPDGMSPGAGVPTMCYTDKPAGWQGGETLAHIQKSRQASEPGSTTTKQQCAADEVNSGGLCYKIPQDGQSWYVSSPGFIALRCPPDSNDSGTTCWYDRGPGTIPDRSACPPGTTQHALTCDYPMTRIGKTFTLFDGNPEQKCKSLWNPHGIACDQGAAGTWSIRGGTCPPGWRDDGAGCVVDARTISREAICPSDREYIDGLCYKKPRPGFNCATTHCNVSKQVTSVIGTVPKSCTAGLVPGPGGLSTFCYPVCPQGFERVEGDVEACLEICPNGWKDIGIGGCERPTFERGVGQPILQVGVCPPGRKKVGPSCMPDES
jgi:hypothetical protein